MARTNLWLPQTMNTRHILFAKKGFVCLIEKIFAMRAAILSVIFKTNRNDEGGKVHDIMLPSCLHTKRGKRY